MKRPLHLHRTQVQAELCRRSLFKFVQQHWDTVIPEEPVWNWHIEYLCHEIQTVAERVFAKLPAEYDLWINVPPGSTKSTIASIMAPAWFWTRMVSARTIGGSHDGLLAMDLARKSRMVIESEKYRVRFPEVKLSGDQNVKSFFENTKHGDRHAIGTGGNVTGFHGHFLIGDDLINPRGVRSEADLKAANDWLRESFMSRKVDKVVSVFIGIMQRLHEDDPTGNQLAAAAADPKKKIRHICLPAEDSVLVKPARLRRRYVGGLLDPVRITREVLDKAKVDLGPFGYAGQFDQNPIPLGGGQFKVDKVNFDHPPTEFSRIVRYWDKAGTKDGQGAYTACAKMAVDARDRVWILDVFRGRWDSGTRELEIYKTAQNDGKRIPVGVEQEPGSGGKESAENTVKRLMGWTVYADRVTGNKIQRADPFSSQVNIGNVYVPIGSPWWDTLKGEMQFFPFSKFKDQIDACSGAFAFLNEIEIKVGAL